MFKVENFNDVIEVLTRADGEFNDNINAYPTVYQSGESELSLELEYVDVDQDHEVIEVKRYVIRIFED